MEKSVFNVGIIDDDETKRTQIISKLDDFVQGAESEIKERYGKYSLNPVELNLCNDIEDLLLQVKEAQINALLVDYQLSSYCPDIKYTGVQFAIRANDKYLGFPIFILTSFEAELYKHEIFNAYQVYDLDRYLNDQHERVEVNSKIVEQCLKYKKEIEQWEEELTALLKREGESNEIDAKILDLDEKLEKTVDGDHSLPKNVKERLNHDNFEEIVTLLNSLLKEDK